MTNHEWIEETVDSSTLGIFSFYSCKNCGATVSDIFFNGVGKPKAIYIPLTCEQLTDNCEESACIIQRYWEKETKRRKKIKYWDVRAKIKKTSCPRKLFKQLYKKQKLK